MARETRSDSLASNMMVLTLMIVTVSVTIISLAALAGVYDLSRAQVSVSHDAVREVFAVEVDSRLTASTRVLDAASTILMDPAAETVDRRALAMQFDTGIEYIDQLLVADADGTVIAGFPALEPGMTVADLSVYKAGITDVTGFHYGADPTGSHLWVSRAVEGSGGEYLVLARVRTTFLEILVREFSATAEDRIVSIIGSGGETLYSGATEVTLVSESIEYEPSEPDGSGAVSALTTQGSVMWGQYALLESHPGLDWRITVIEPRATMVASTWRALTPAVIALLVTGVISFSLAMLFARRLVAPLRALESHALEAVSGAYVPPIRTDRRDEVGRLAEAFNALALRLNALQDLSQLLASSSSLDQVLDGILSAMGHIVGTTNIAILLVDDSRTHLVVARSRGLAGADDLVIPLKGQNWLSQALESTGPATFSGMREDVLRAMPGLEGKGSVSGLVAPLQVGSEPLGIIIVMQRDERRFSQAEMEMVRTFSAQAAVAVNNSRLFEIESGSRREAEAMRTVAEALANPLDLQRSFDTVMRIALRLFAAASTTIAFMDRPALGLPPAEDMMTERLLLAAWKSVWAAGDGDLVARVSPGDDPVIDRYLEARHAGEALFLTVMRAEQPGAVVSLEIDKPGRVFTAHERSLAYSLGKQLALALDNAFHYAQARLRAANLETIFRISQAVSSSLQIKVVLNRVLDVVQKIFSADTVSLMQFDDVTRTIDTAMARGIISTEMLHFSCVPGQDVPGRVFQAGEPVKIDDLYAVETELAEIALGQGLHSMLSVPLLARGRSIGVLTVFSALPSAFTVEDMGLLHTFASQAALAIDTAALYGREHHVASVLQGSILPKSLPVYPEIESSSVYLPAGEEVEIGGDYFDLFKDVDGKLVLAIADVCGKGVEAATKTSMIKYLVRGLVAAGLGPAAVMSEVNRAVSETGDTTDIVTLWLGQLDLDAGVLRYADGGHPPAVIRRAATGHTELLETTGALLGALIDAEYDEIDVAFDPDDVLVLYTDGVTEARRGNKFFGEGRVRRAVGAGGSANDVVDRLLGSLDRFIPGALRDDAAILAVRMRTAEERDVAANEK